MPNFYKELPEGFKEDYVIDAKSKKVTFMFTFVSFVLIVLGLLPFIPKFIRLKEQVQTLETKNLIIYYVLFMVMMVGYIVLHELTHGIVYKLMTHEKLTYGFTLTVAFCGVPNLYISKKTAYLSLLAPFTVYSIALILGAVLASSLPLFVIFGITFAIHFGGCVGDLYGTMVLLFRYKGKEVLVNDTGPKQTFYIK